MLQIGSKDIDIFRILSSGATSYSEIEDMLERVYKYRVIKVTVNKNKQKSEGSEYRENQSQKKRRAETTDREITRKRLRNRLSEMKREGYLASRLYPNREGSGITALYALTPLSTAILISKGYDNNWIRASLPSVHFVEHDRMVTKTVHAIKRESGRAGYDFGIVGAKNKILLGKVIKYQRGLIIETLNPFQTDNFLTKDIKYAYPIQAVLSLD